MRLTNWRTVPCRWINASSLIALFLPLCRLLHVKRLESVMGLVIEFWIRSPRSFPASGYLSASVQAALDFGPLHGRRALEACACRPPLAHSLTLRLPSLAYRTSINQRDTFRTHAYTLSSTSASSLRPERSQRTKKSADRAPPHPHPPTAPPLISPRANTAANDGAQPGRLDRLHAARQCR